VYLRPRLVFLMVLAVLLAALGANSGALAASPNLATILNVTPQNALPNQTVTLLGSGFTPSTTAGRAGRPARTRSPDREAASSPSGKLSWYLQT